MLRSLLAVEVLLWAVCLPAQSGPKNPVPGHYLFAWTGDPTHRANDFLAVIDADPASPSYGHLITTLPTDQRTDTVHHTEYVMPASGMLFANDHGAGRTFIFDVRDPLRPSIAHSFNDIAGYMHPHSYVRLPNGHVLASFQHSHHNESAEQAETGTTGGLVEIDDEGNAIRSVGTADPAYAGALLSPYGLVVLPEIDRIVATNSSMHLEDIFLGVSYQIWRLSDLKLLRTEFFDVGPNRYGHVSPEEPRLASDGSIFVQTLACGLERITGVAGSKPKSKFVYSFSGDWCGVPTIIGHYYIESVPAVRGLVVLDISDPEDPSFASRLKLADNSVPHWTGWDEKTERLVVTGQEPRLYLLKFDQRTGILTLDRAFHDVDGKPGFNFDRAWPHGWKGAGQPHGVVFSR